MTKYKSDFRGKIKKDAEKQKTSGGSTYLNLPNGVKSYRVEADTRRVKLDFLPYIVSDQKHPIAKPGTLWWRRPVLLHTNVGTDNERIVCPKTFGKPCPICEFQKKRFNEGAPKEETKEYYPQKRSLYAVIAVDDSDDIMVWDMADKMFLNVLADELEENDDNENFPSLEDGKTLEVAFKWNTIGEKGKPFPEARSIKFLDREVYDESILKEVPDLDKVLVVLSYEEIANKFMGVEVDEEKGELRDAEEKPERRKRFHKEEHNEEPEPEAEEKPKTFHRERKTEKEAEVDETPEPQRHRRNIKEEDPEPEEKSKRSRESKNTEKERCPHGHVFGVDTDKFNDCDKCEIWDACIDEKEKK